MSLVVSFGQESFALTSKIYLFMVLLIYSSTDSCIPFGLSKLLHYLHVSPLVILTHIPSVDADLARYLTVTSLLLFLLGHDCIFLWNEEILTGGEESRRLNTGLLVAIKC